MNLHEISNAVGSRMRIGIDLGGTKIEGIILDPTGREVWRERVPTSAKEGYNAVLSRIVQLYQLMVRQIDAKPHTLGICTPGSISTVTGLLKNCNATELNGHPLQTDLRARLCRDFTLENDANCFALAESMVGAGRGHEVVLGLVVGTGVGAGVVFNRRLHCGRNHIAGEWGHISLDPLGDACYCGRRGCVERLISGRALEASYLQRTRKSLTLFEIAKLEGGGEPHARALLEEFLEWFVQGVANVIAVLDPDVVVLGGGLASLESLYLPSTRARLAGLVFNDSFSTPVLKNELGNSAGVVGAALVGV